MDNSKRNKQATTTENPWHNISGLRKYVRVPGIPLPKRLLRPFFYHWGTSINDKEYKIVSYSTWKDNLKPPYLIVYAITAVLGFLCVTAPSDNVELLIMLFCFLALALILHRAHWRYLNNQTCYSRHSGVVRYEFGLFRLKYYELPFRECEGRVVSTTNVLGLVWHRLILTHPAYSKNMLLLSARSIDEILGFWSLIAKYMDGTKKLPDIWQLNSYPNREKGLGEYYQWLESLQKQEIEDLFIAWLDKLKQQPELDIANYGRNLSYSGFIETWMDTRAFIAFSGLFLAGIAALAYNDVIFYYFRHINEIFLWPR